eukprot:CAMPEP_0182599580 /NCGR_PEP_ID=MMETSP1324-20130603/90552_1 /TAXON_ID=236786 /ORGANISM="Florenciella sp., Strain RCC1587" /LENGTH=141 /DNA_ID=CAMNT_0024817479 /DNA_START=575 /DNA_END=1000 /DNA_ORIENTATION=+
MVDTTLVFTSDSFSFELVACALLQLLLGPPPTRPLLETREAVPTLLVKAVLDPGRIVPTMTEDACPNPPTMPDPPRPIAELELSPPSTPPPCRPFPGDVGLSLSLLCRLSHDSFFFTMCFVSADPSSACSFGQSMMLNGPK